MTVERKNVKTPPAQLQAAKEVRELIKFIDVICNRRSHEFTILDLTCSVESWEKFLEGRIL